MQCGMALGEHWESIREVFGLHRVDFDDTESFCLQFLASFSQPRVSLFHIPYFLHQLLVAFYILTELNFATTRS